MFHDDKGPLEPEYTPFPQTQEERFSGFYETGNIRPPKNHGGWVAAVLLTCIFLGGLAGGAILINLSEHMQQETSPEVQSPTNPVTLTETQSSEPMETEQPILEATGPHGDDTELIISSTSEAVPNIPQSGGLSLQEIYRKVSPSVVSITAQQASGTSYGSGIIMSQSGYIITNCHVVNEAYHLLVTLSDGQEHDAQLVGKDSISDLAVLHIDATGLTAAEFGDSTQAQVGDAVVAIGDPLGTELRGTMTSGIISAINRNLTIQGHALTLMPESSAEKEGHNGQSQKYFPVIADLTLDHILVLIRNTTQNPGIGHRHPGKTGVGNSPPPGNGIQAQGLKHILNSLERQEKQNHSRHCHPLGAGKELRQIRKCILIVVAHHALPSRFIRKRLMVPVYHTCHKSATEKTLPQKRQHFLFPDWRGSFLVSPGEYRVLPRQC